MTSKALDFWKTCSPPVAQFRAIAEKEYLVSGALPISDTTPMKRDVFVLKPLSHNGRVPLVKR